MCMWLGGLRFYLEAIQLGIYGIPNRKGWNLL